jgi:DNA-binding NarL/FixJ family response regulator
MAGTIRLNDGPRKEKLTRREREVLELIVEGHKDESIAAHLGIALNTLKHHTKNLFRKTGFNSRLDLAVTTLKRRHTEEIELLRGK